MNHTNNNTKNLSTSDSKKSNDARKRRIRENSHYNEKDQPAPDNNLFWEDASNPLSSKGNEKKPEGGSFLYRPQKVRPKNLTIGGRYFYG